MSLERSELQRAAEWLLSAKRVLVFSGAGISVASGIPDFRSPGGLWERFDPYDYAHIDSFRSDPRRVWRMLSQMLALIIPARPNAAHIAVAEMAHMLRLSAIITQNIDELHQAAGSVDVVEFHGSAKRFTCLNCDRVADSGDVLSGKLGSIPLCWHCGSVLKPDIVFFGEGIPPKALERAFAEAERADIMLVVGTSAEVAPANLLPEQVISGGGRLIEINLEPTRLSRSGVLSLFGRAEEVLPSLILEIRDLIVSRA